MAVSSLYSHRIVLHLLDEARTLLEARTDDPDKLLVRWIPRQDLAKYNEHVFVENVSASYEVWTGGAGSGGAVPRLGTLSVEFSCVSMRSQRDELEAMDRVLQMAGVFHELLDGRRGEGFFGGVLDEDGVGFVQHAYVSGTDGPDVAFSDRGGFVANIGVSAEVMFLVYDEERGS